MEQTSGVTSTNSANNSTSISRRAVLAGGVVALCGMASSRMPHVAFANETSGTAGIPDQIADLLETLDDDGLLELEKLIRTEKEQRGIQSFLIGGGTYTAGIDIDPGAYDIYVYAEEDKGYYILDVKIYKKGDDSFDTWELVYSGDLYRVVLEEGDRMKLALDGDVSVCTISPAKKISFF